MDILMKKIYTILVLILIASSFLIAQQADISQAEFARLKSTPKSDVFMQGFYWNPPPGGIWYDSLAKLAPRLASAGFSGIWFPPPEKGAAGGYSMGYDPYDHFDFGEFDQKGSRETRFGSRDELIHAINTFHAVGINVYADAVMRHMNGADEKGPYECKPYPSWPDSAWMVFTYPYGSGRFLKTQADFIPNFNVCDVNYPYHGPDDPIYRFGEWLCHEKSRVRDSLIVWGLYMRNVLGFDGFRLDAVKHIDPSFMGVWLNSVNQGGFAVAENWSGTSDIATWHYYCENVYGGGVSMFDFPLRYALQDMCNTTSGAYWMTNLDGAGLVNNGMGGYDVATFVENHDFDRIQYDGSIDNGHNPIVSNKEMAYAYTLFSEGRPCVWFRDYFGYGLSGKIDTLIWIRQNFLYGGTTKRDGLNPYYVGGGGSQDDMAHDIYIARRNGGDGKPEAYIVINDNPSLWLGVWVNTGYGNTEFKDYIGRAMNKTSAGDGRVDLWAPPRGYAIYIPDASQYVNNPPYILTMADQVAFKNTLFSVQVPAGDPNNDSLGYALSGNPSWLSISSSGLLTGTPGVSDTGTTEIIITVSDPLGLTSSDTVSLYVSGHPVMDGTFEGTGVWGDPLVIADTNAGWNGAQAKSVYTTEDDTYFYFGADITALQSMNWAFLLMSKYGGGSTDSWSRSITYAHRDLPDYIFRGNFTGYAELHNRDYGWWSGVGSPLNGTEYADNIIADTVLQDGWVEGRVTKSSLNNPSGFAVQFYLTGDQNGNATFDACPDDSNTTVESGVTTSLRNYVKYGQVGISFANLQWPPSAFLNLGQSVTVYGRVYALEVTDSTGRGPAINAWVGYDTADTDPGTWTHWQPATFNVDVGTMDEYQSNLGASLSKGVYYYAVRYQLNSGEYVYGGYSTSGGGTWDGVNNVSGVLFLEMPPLAPSLVYPVGDTVNIPKSTTFRWDAAPSASKYRIQISTAFNFSTFLVDDSTLTSTSKAVSTMAYLTKYYWRVIGKNTSGWGAWSAIDSFTTVISPPLATTLVLPVNGAVNQSLNVQLQWNSSATATAYRVIVATDSLATHKVMDDTTDALTIPATGLSNSVTYFWLVRALNLGGSSSSTPSWRFTTIITAPPAPSLVTPLQGDTGQLTFVEVRWNRLATAERYRIEVASDTNFTQIIFIDTSVTDTGKQVSGLSAGTKYFWRVRGINIGGVGAYSIIRSFTTARVITNSYSIETNWNLISLPFRSEVSHRSNLFPTAVSSAFSFVQGAGYVPNDTMINGKGYWMKFPDAQSVSLSGFANTIDSVSVTAGWNLVGTLSSAVSVSSIIQSPSGIVTSAYFGYTQLSGYTAATVLQPMKAYWVKTNAGGKLHLRSSTVLSKGLIGPGKE